MRVEVVQACAHEYASVVVVLPAGATVRDAVIASGLLGGDQGNRKFGIFGRAVEPEAAVFEGDRVEVYRPLRADPKEARRQRAKKKPGR